MKANPAGKSRQGSFFDVLHGKNRVECLRENAFSIYFPVKRGMAVIAIPRYGSISHAFSIIYIILPYLIYKV